MPILGSRPGVSVFSSRSASQANPVSMTRLMKGLDERDRDRALFNLAPGLKTPDSQPDATSRGKKLPLAGRSYICRSGSAVPRAPAGAHGLHVEQGGACVGDGYGCLSWSVATSIRPAGSGAICGAQTDGVRPLPPRPADCEPMPEGRAPLRTAASHEAEGRGSARGSGADRRRFAKLASAAFSHLTRSGAPTSPTSQCAAGACTS